MKEIVINIMIPILIVSLIIFLIVYNTKNSNNDKEIKSNNNEENKNEIVFSPKNFFEIGLSFGFGVLAAEIFLIAIICFIYKLFQ